MHCRIGPSQNFEGGGRGGGGPLVVPKQWHVLMVALLPLPYTDLLDICELIA